MKKLEGKLERLPVLRKEKFPLSEIEDTVFVRVNLDEERVSFFMRLYEAGASVPPLEITEDKQMIEGRHRKAALVRMGLSEAACNVYRKMGREELTLRALAANFGGSQPPTQADINYTIKQLLEGGMTRLGAIRNVKDATGLPINLVKRTVDVILLRIKTEKVNEAVIAMVEDDLTAAAAAKKFGVEVVDVKSALTGKKRNPDKNDFESIKNALTSRFRSLSAANAKAFGSLMGQLVEKEVSADLVGQSLKHYGQLVKRMTHNHDELQKRFDAITGKDSKKEKKEAPVKSGSKKK